MKKTDKKIYAFIDSQNLNLGTSKDLFRHNKKIYKGWRLDYKKFRKYLWDKFRVTKAYLFIGYIHKNRRMYKSLESYGFDLIFKPTVKDGQGKPKGNVDAEMVLYASAKEFYNYHKAVVVSGDGDFSCLYEYLKDKNKLLRIVIPNAKSESTLLRRYQKYKTFIIFDKDKLEWKP